MPAPLLGRLTSLRVLAFLGLLAATGNATGNATGTNPSAVRDRRVVDAVEAGVPLSELDHGYAAHNDSSGTENGRVFRQARGWIRYALITFDDTDVTIACTFLGTTPGNYDLVVEDSLIASKRFDVTTGAPAIVEILVPFALTKGKASIVVMLRARGGPTPRLHELRTIQDHNEVLALPIAVVQAPLTSVFSPSGVAR